MSERAEIFLDVETDWDRGPTVVGFRSSLTGLVQLVGLEITPSRLFAELPPAGRLSTYNGHCFDLPCIRAHLGVNLRDYFESLDLRWVCQKCGLTGGQKVIEEQIGFRRATVGMDGLEAIRLWHRFQAGDRRALERLLRYNADDVGGIAAIHRYLVRRNLLGGE